MMPGADDCGHPEGQAAPGPVDWRQGTPRNPRYGDVYHSASGALAQARHVFLGGCALPEAWADRPSWRVLETGFGLGLNFLATWRAWRADPKRPRRLDWLAIEAHPVRAEDIDRAAGAEAELAGLGLMLAGAWPDDAGARLADADSRPAGFGRIEAAFDGGAVRLTVLLGAAPAALETLAAEAGAEDHADSVFLDGFSPARNPAMWSARTLAAVGRLTRPGARLATWAVARTVRDGLAANGFTVMRRPGLPPKRDCLAAIRDRPAGSYELPRHR